MSAYLDLRKTAAELLSLGGRFKTITGFETFDVTTNAVKKEEFNGDITINVLSGSVYLRLDGTDATANDDSIKLSTANAVLLNIRHKGDISFISDGTGAKV